MVVLNINLKHEQTVTIIYAIRIKQDGVLHKNAATDTQKVWIMWRSNVSTKDQRRDIE